MARQYKTYRHFLNAKLHALSAVICGDDQIIDAWLEEHKFNSVKDIPNQEAKLLYECLLKRASLSAKTHRKFLQIGGQAMTDNQYKMIVAKTRYEFGWSTEAVFSYILKTHPHLGKKLNSIEIKNNDVGKLLRLMSRVDGDKLIKRLLSIKKWNEDHHEKNS